VLLCVEFCVFCTQEYRIFPHTANVKHMLIAVPLD
jgi:hypothetical protein